MVLKSRVLEEKRNDSQEEPLATSMPSPISTPDSGAEKEMPLSYAGAPESVKDEESVDEKRLEVEKEKTEVGKGANVEKTASASSLNLPRADRLIEEGEDLPGYAVTNLDNETISRIVEAGRGRVIAMCDKDLDLPRVLVNWGTQGPEGYRVALADKWMEGLSQRAIELPASMENRVRREVEKELSLRTGSVMLFLNHDLDRLILSSQISACMEEGIDLEKVRKTVGRLTSGETGIGNYRVESFELKDGAIRRPHGARHSNDLQFEIEKERDGGTIAQSTAP
jgi:hypothetical protein